MIKKILVVLSVALCVFAVGYNVYHMKKIVNNGKRNVYAVLPLTGSIAKSGQEYKQVLDLYQKSNPDSQLHFIYVDSAFIPSQAVSALQSKIVLEKKPLVIATGTTIALAILNIVAEKGGFVLISGGARPTNAQKNNYWNFSAGNGLGMDKIAEYINQKHKSVALFYPNSDYGVLTYQRLNQKLDNTVKLVFKESFDTAISDVRTLALKALQHHPESIIITGPANQNFINLFRVLREMDYQGEIIGDLTFNQPAVLNALEKKAEGITFLTLDPLLDKPATSPGQAFQNLFTKAGIKPSFAHVEAYNMALLLEAIAHQKDLSQQYIIDQKNLETASGTVDFLENGDSKFSYVLATIQNGKVVSIEK